MPIYCAAISERKNNILFGPVFFLVSTGCQTVDEAFANHIYEHLTTTGLRLSRETIAAITAWVRGNFQITVTSIIVRFAR